MLIKTTHDDLADHHFISFPDDDDTKQEHDITTIYYKIWAVNTGNRMLQSMNIKKIGKDEKCYNL